MMLHRTTTGLAGLVVVLFLAHDASAQVRRDSLGPVRCFELVDAAQLAEQSAISLCAGAISEAPGRCYAVGIDEFHELSSQKVQQLCVAATSLEPLECYGRLSTEGVLTEDQIISYCATTCPVSPPPPQSSDPACLQEALDRTDLSLQSAGELCADSSSAGPVACYVAGDAIETLADTQLIQLCAEQVRCQYYNSSASPY